MIRFFIGFILLLGGANELDMGGPMWTSVAFMTAGLFLMGWPIIASKRK